MLFNNNKKIKTTIASFIIYTRSFGSGLFQFSKNEFEKNFKWQTQNKEENEKQAVRQS